MATLTKSSVDGRLSNAVTISAYGPFRMPWAATVVINNGYISTVGVLSVLSADDFGSESENVITEPVFSY